MHGIGVSLGSKQGCTNDGGAQPEVPDDLSHSICKSNVTHWHFNVTLQASEPVHEGLDEASEDVCEQKYVD